MATTAKELLEAVSKMTKESAEVVQAQSARIAKLEGEVADKEEIVKVAKQLINSGTIKPEYEEDTIRCLSTHKAAIDLLGNLAEYNAKQASVESVGRPIETAKGSDEEFDFKKETFAAVARRASK